MRSGAAHTSKYLAARLPRMRVWCLRNSGWKPSLSPQQHVPKFWNRLPSSPPRPPLCPPKCFCLTASRSPSNSRSCMRLGLYSRSSSSSSRTDLISTACKDTSLSQRMHGREQPSLATTRSHARGASACRPLQRQQPPILHSGILAVSCCISSSSRRYFICTPCTCRGASQLMHDSAAHMAALLRVHATAALESVPFAIGSIQILSDSLKQLQ